MVFGKKLHFRRIGIGGRCEERSVSVGRGFIVTEALFSYLRYEGIPDSDATGMTTLVWEF